MKRGKEANKNTAVQNQNLQHFLVSKSPLSTYNACGLRSKYVWGVFDCWNTACIGEADPIGLKRVAQFGFNQTPMNLNLAASPFQLTMHLQMRKNGII